MAYVKSKSKKFNGAKNKYSSRKSTNGGKDSADTATKDNAKFNDPSWYIREGQMAKDVASLSFNNALGSNYTLMQELGTTAAVNSYTDVLPGILAINMVPAMGATYDARSPINVAAKNIVGFIRSYNSGAKNYDSPDLMLMLGAMDSIYALIAHFMRAYGTARVFSHTNRYIGDALLYAMGFNASEVRQNLANFRSYINMLITKASAICTPSIMTVYARHFWMFSGVYKDEDIDKSQMYLYRPVALWSYEEMDGAGYLKANPVGAVANGYLNGTLWTLTEWEDLADSMIGKLLNSQDVAVMSGDILKAYGEGNLWKLSLINEDYATIPVYSEEVLDQIHNTTFLGGYITKGATPTSTTVDFDLSGLDVTQSTDLTPWLFFQPQFFNASAASWTRLMDLVGNDPDPERVMVASRNMAMVQAFATAGNKVVCSLSTCGSDIAINAGLISYGINGTLTNILLFNQDVSGISTNVLGLWKFRRAPLIYKMASGTGGGNLTGIEGAVDNYTNVSFDDLRRMHESALLAMLGVPFYGLQTR